MHTKIFVILIFVFSYVAIAQAEIIISEQVADQIEAKTLKEKQACENVLAEFSSDKNELLILSGQVTATKNNQTETVLVCIFGNDSKPRHDILIHRNGYKVVIKDWNELMERDSENKIKMYRIIIGEKNLEENLMMK